MESKLISLFPLLLLLLLALFLHSSSALDCGSIVIYWGQNGNEVSLNETCSTGRYSIVHIAFLCYFGGGQTPTLNLAGHCDPTLPTGNCAFVGKHIDHCQKLGVKVTLSLGGSAGNYTLASKKDAYDLSDYIWNNFLGGNKPSPSGRPLGPATLDGVDLAISQGSSKHYPYLVRRLRSHDEKMLITGAPRCKYPDEHLGRALKRTRFDYVWVQIYDDAKCEYNNKSGARNLVKTWRRWTTSKSLNVSKVFLGLPAAEFGTGFIPAKVMTSKIIPAIKKMKMSWNKYGGVMLWSKFWDEQTNYSAQIIRSVKNCTKCE